MKKISIFGSTGSIGVSTLEVIRQHPDKFQLETLIGNRNIAKLIEQSREFSPKYAITADENAYLELKTGLAGMNIQVMAGNKAINDIAQAKTDIAIAAITGSAGLSSTFWLAKNSRILAIANKESLVLAGEMLIAEAEKSGCKILPIDSEHNAIFQLFEEGNRAQIEKIILTASGGPFRDRPAKELESVTIEEALNHPNWQMGQKITIDSATMMNKGLELIEAYHLFGLKESQIEVIIHPESIIHSLVGYCDGSFLAQLGTADMCTPISYCLAWPKRIAIDRKKLNLAEIANLSFKKPDLEKFQCLHLAREVLKTGGSAPIIMNGANEIAVNAFLDGKIKFTSIYKIIDETLNSLKLEKAPESIDEVLNYDKIARKTAAFML